MLKKIIVSICCCFWLLSLTANETDVIPDFTIRGAKVCNWWIKGDTINFRAVPSQIGKDANSLAEYRRDLKSGKKIPTVIVPANWKKIIGTVFDSNGKKVSSRSVPATKFQQSGWSKQIHKPGFYRVKFQAELNNGKQMNLVEPNKSKPSWTGKIPTITINRTFHNFTVMPGKVPQNSNLPWFGVDSYPFAYRFFTIEAMALMGFEFARIHYLDWKTVEPAKGKYNYKYLNNIDNFLGKLKNIGITNNICNINRCPRWASSNPDAPGKSSWEDNYWSYAPAKMSDYADFLQFLVKRFPQIKIWEPWNEPHFPGKSIFWRSSPEEYVELQKTAYKTIKAIQPDATVWLSGIGMRYLPFYRRILKLGVGNYFDVLPLHGRNNTPEPFEAMNSYFNIKSKPWVNGEWHAVLYKTGALRQPSEEQISHDMLVDMMRMFKYKVDKIATWTWWQSCETEFYKHFNKHGARKNSIGGFFRVTPYMEPRLPMMVLRNFVSCLSGKVKFKGNYQLPGKQKVVLLSSDAGDLLCFWHDGKKNATPSQELLKTQNSESELWNWEGQTLTLNKNLRLESEKIYFLRNPSSTTAQMLKKYTKDIFKTNMVLLHQAKGFFVKERIFDDNLNIINSGQLAWNKIDQFKLIKKTGLIPENFTGRYAISLTAKGVDLLVEVNDTKHVQNTPDKMWNGDSIQFAFASSNEGKVSDRIEFVAGLINHTPSLRKTFAVSILGDHPAHYTFPGNNAESEVKYGKVKIDQNGSITRYKIHVTSDDMFPISFEKTKLERFSLLVNNNNGQGRIGYISWADGIGNGKSPVAYGDLTVALPEKTLLTLDGLNQKSNCVELKRTGTLLRVKSLAKKFNTAGSIRAKHIPFESGARYRMTVEARGNVKLYCMAAVTGKGIKKRRRLNFIKGYKLSDKWTSLEGEIIIPPGYSYGDILVFTWKQDGYFELKNFKIETVTSKAYSCLSRQ